MVAVLPRRRTRATRLALLGFVVAPALALAVLSAKPTGAASGIDHLTWSPSPIAATGSLAPGAFREFVVTAYDSSNNPIPSVTVYLSLAPAVGGTATAVAVCGTGGSGGGTLTSSLAACQTGATSGAVAVKYVSSNPLPNGGSDVFTAAADGSGTLATTDTYTYASIDHFSWNPSPIAAAGSLAPGAFREFVVTAYDSSNNPIPSVTVYLSLAPAVGGTATAVAVCGTGGSGGGTLTSSLAACQTGATSGAVAVKYVSSNPLPNGGSDVFTAAADGSGTLATTDTYTYASIDHFSWNPSPIAATGSLAPGAFREFVVTAYDSSNNPIPSVTVYLSLAPAVGGTATAVAVCGTGGSGGGTLTSSLAACQTGATGAVA